MENVASPFWHGPASSPHGSKGRAAPTHSRFCIPGATYPAGATLTIAAWNASRGGVTIANVGDSAALLVDAAGSRLLTEEHRLSDSAAERERVLASGSKLGRAMSSATGLAGARPGAHALTQCPGHAQSSGGLGLYARACRPPRVCCAGGPIRCYPGGLAVCRAIGDADVGAAISAVPAVHTVTCDITASGSALIICSDGVWDSLTHDQVVKCTVQCASVAEAAKRVVDKASRAYTRGLRDDITAAVAWLGTPPWQDKPSARRRLLQRLSRTRDWLCSRDSGFDANPSQSPSPNPRVKASPLLAKGFGGGRASSEHSQPPGSPPSTPAALSPFSERPPTAAKSQSPS